MKRFLKLAIVPAVLLGALLMGAPQDARADHYRRGHHGGRSSFSIYLGSPSYYGGYSRGYYGGYYPSYGYSYRSYYPRSYSYGYGYPSYYSRPSYGFSFSYGGGHYGGGHHHHHGGGHHGGHHHHH